MLGKTTSFVTLCAFVFGVVSVGEAQMINYKRRQQRMTKPKAAAKAAQPAVRKKASSVAASSAERPDQINYYRTEQTDSSAQRNGDGEPAVTNRVERLYDLNRDGYLQGEEVNDFYKDVVSSVRNKGSFRVSSELLRNFDANRDGQISRYEVDEISNQIN